MIDIGFDAVRDSDELSRAEMMRVAAALREQLEELQSERDELLFCLERLDERIDEIKQSLLE